MPFRIALSGLNAASGELRVIGHNVANAGTTGFKKSRAEFADIFATSRLGTSSNAIGSGVRLGSVAQQFTQGNIGFTDNSLDLAIAGQGFFRMEEPNGSVMYKREGSFKTDNQGFIVNNQNQFLTGFQADSSGTITRSTGPLQISTANLAPRATTSVEVGVNLDSTSTAIPAGTAFDPSDASTYSDSTSMEIYDEQGTPHLATFYFRADNSAAPAANRWEVYTVIDGTTVPPAAPLNAGDGFSTVDFNTDGSLSAIDGNAVPPTQFALSAYSPGGGAGPMNLTMDLGSITQYGSAFDLNQLSQDGYETGRIDGIDIGDSGVILARYTNGQSLVQGQVALANFSNPQGLQQLGDTSWAETFSSGAPLVSEPGSGSLGNIQSGALEGSNVDLTEQLVNMITAQRNFQANAQVITTADTVTQTIINIR